MTDQLPTNESQSPTTSDSSRRWWGRGAAVGAAVLVLAGAGAGVGMAVTADNPSPSPAGPTTTVAPGGGKYAGKHTGAKDKVDPARQAWAHQYGLDRSTMPMLADVASASSDQQAAAADLLARTQAATAKYADLATAKAAGFDLQADLAQEGEGEPR